MTTPSLCFLKLGGSLITDKNAPHTPRLDVLQRLANEIARAQIANPAQRLIIGHGSGSFGHVPAHQHKTRQGVSTPEQWRGFVEVWQEARALNQIVVEQLSAAGLPVIAFPPSASVQASAGRVSIWNLQPILSAIDAGLIPLINGDVIFDEKQGGTILSTEELFAHLAEKLKPKRILIAGIEGGVWADFPACQHLIERITPATFNQIAGLLGGSAAVDVTGGMLKKVENMIDLVNNDPGLTIQIFSGITPGNLYDTLMGASIGTTLGA
jgi:isopentenyl phosphate kinase